MNFKRFHESKNLWDGTYTKGFIGTTYIYKNTGTSANCAIIPCEPSTTYTVKKHDESNRFAIGTSNVLPYDEIQLTGIYYLDSATSYTFTTDSSAHYMVVYVSTGTEQAEPRLMVNTGSQPLPYEPYSSEVWHNIPHYIHKTDTDTITTPADIYPNDTTATVGLKGDMSQSSTPTPSSPIQPQECGERTGNLWNAEGFSARAINSTHEHSNTNPYGTTLSSTTGKEVSITQANYPTGNAGYQNGFFMIDVDFSKYAVGDVVTISFDYIVNEIHSLSTQKTTSVYAGKDSNAAPLTLSSGDWKISGRLTAKITIIADMRPYVEVRLCGNSITVKNIMLNTGSQPLPYESYGYKIPILSGSTTTPVYLGEVQTTRKIKKLMLTGQENWEVFPVGTGRYFRYMISSTVTAIANVGICSHYKRDNIGTSTINTDIFTINAPSAGGNGVVISPSDVTLDTASDFKTYLAQQYANGTPVTVWYVLATPETAVVNEPLRKIGTYADEVSGITIPTIAGANTISVDTTLQPSEVTVNYKGWHPVSAVHERESGAWD